MLHNRTGVLSAAGSQATDDARGLRNGLSLAIGGGGRCSPCLRGEMDYEGGRSDDIERTPDIVTDVGRMSEAVKWEGHIPVERLTKENLHGVSST